MQNFLSEKRQHYYYLEKVSGHNEGSTGRYCRDSGLILPICDSARLTASFEWIATQIRLKLYCLFKGKASMGLPDFLGHFYRADQKGMTTAYGFESAVLTLSFFLEGLRTPQPAARLLLTLSSHFCCSLEMASRPWKNRNRIPFDLFPCDRSPRIQPRESPGSV